MNVTVDVSKGRTGGTVSINSDNPHKHYIDRNYSGYSERVIHPNSRVPSS